MGLTVAEGGEVRRVLLGSAADRAQMAPDLEIVGVGEHRWSGEKLLDAVRKSSEGQPIDLLLASGDRLLTRQIQYYDGLRYWNLERDERQPDRLAEILKPRTK